VSAAAPRGDGAILVVGARSRVGGELVRLLLQRGAAVRVLSRSGAGPAGARAVRGDLDDAASLRAAVDGAAAVFLLSSPGERQAEQHARAVDAARTGGVRHLVRSSILGADPAADCLLRRLNGAADEHLRASGVPSTVLRPHYFQQNVPDLAVPALVPDPAGSGASLLHAAVGSARISMVDARDVAAAAAAVLTAPDHGAEHHGLRYDLCGPEALDHDGVAARLSRHLGRPVVHADVPSAVARDALLAAGAPAWLAGALADLYDDYRRSGPDGYAAATPPDVEALTGRPARSLDALLAERLGATATGGPA
jgi:uncharacterized protein YbjT (DUF2867 family)